MMVELLVDYLKQLTTSFYGLWADKPLGMLVDNQKNSAAGE